MIIWFTGNSGSGKTTLAKVLQEKVSNPVILDGDEMRASISLGAGFSLKEREKHNLRVARLAKVLDEQELFVIVSVIAPTERIRKEIEKIIKPDWIYVKRDLLADPNKPYEPPENPGLVIDNDKYSKEQAAMKLILYLENYIYV